MLDQTADKFVAEMGGSTVRVPEVGVLVRGLNRQPPGPSYRRGPVWSALRRFGGKRAKLMLLWPVLLLQSVKGSRDSHVR